MKVLAGALAALVLASPGAASAQSTAGAARLDPRKMIEHAGKDQALEEAVRQIERDPAQAGAWLDLAVGLCQKGRGADSQAVLAHVQSTFAPPEGILEVINLLRASECEGPRQNYRVTAAVQRGYDNNVNQGASNPLFELGSTTVVLAPEFLPRGDGFVQMDATMAWAPREGVQLNVQARAKKFDQLAELDTRILAAGADREWSCASGRCGIGFTAGRIDLGGAPYQYIGSVQAGRVGAPGLWGGTVAVEGGVTRQYFPNQRSLDSWIGLGKLTWRLPVPAGGLVQLSATAGLDVPTADRPGGKRKLVAAGVAGTHGLGSGYQLDWSLQHQSTRDAEIYSPGTVDIVRRPLLHVASVGVTKSLTASQKLRLEYRQATNRDTVSLFSYRSRALLLTWQWRGDY